MRRGYLRTIMQIRAEVHSKECHTRIGTPCRLCIACWGHTVKRGRGIRAVLRKIILTSTICVRAILRSQEVSRLFRLDVLHSVLVLEGNVGGPDLRSHLILRLSARSCSCSCLCFVVLSARLPENKMRRWYAGTWSNIYPR